MTRGVRPGLTNTAATETTVGASGWLDAADPLYLALSSRQRELLAWPGSLTELIRDLSGDRMQLKVLGEHLGQACDYQTGRLQLAGDDCWVREIVIHGGPEPWVFAQTLLDPSARAALGWLRKLGGRPLGDELFRHADMTRDDFAFQRLAAPGGPLRQQAANAANLPASAVPWARRSLIGVDGQNLQITEVFLPALLERR